METRPRILVEMQYDKAADEYLKGMKLENFMEAPPQATQREITLESFALMKTRRPDIQLFNELLVQYPNPNKRKRRPQQVVPDNMVVVWSEPLKVRRSYILPLQPCGPFWVMEYVSKTNKRKDYDQSMRKYEHELKVPYYLLFVPEEQELSLYHHNGTKYLSLHPNRQKRYAIPEIEMAIGLLDGWVRFWYQGELLPLPAEMQNSLDNVSRKLDEARREREEANHRADRAEQEARRLRKQLEALQKQR